jgi:Methyltransferase domain
MATQTIDTALGEVREALLDRSRLVRAIAAGRRHGQRPSVVRVDLHPVAIKAGPRLQVVASDGARPHTRNVEWGDEAAAEVDSLLAEPFANWHVETTTAVLEIRITKRGNAQVHRAQAKEQARPSLGHDRDKAHLLDPGNPLFTLIGANGAKRRQVDAFVRAVVARIPLPASADLTDQSNQDQSNQDQAGRQPLHAVDLGCGNAYLTFAAYDYLTQQGLDIKMTGIDVREDQRIRNTELARKLGWEERVRFVASTIAEARLEPADGVTADEEVDVDVVFALHACDTATDEALARAMAWRSRYIFVAPCCHHDVAAQLRRSTAPQPYGPLVQDAILRERFSDTLTDALRAALLRSRGYNVDVVEFVESAHTPRNVLIRASRIDQPSGQQLGDQQSAGKEYRELVEAWGVQPHLATLLADLRI